jgi:hypothetical protein
MAIQNYPDGFPGTPTEAINFSYFLSESEKNEWREWLATANEEQKEELVDILHSMWQDNQKNAVPESFANNIISSPQPFQEPSQQPPINQNFNPSPGPINNFQPQPQPQASPFSQQPQPFGNPQSNQNPPAFFGDYQQNQPQPQPFQVHNQPQNFPQPPHQFDNFPVSQNHPIAQNTNYSNQNPPAFNQNHDFNSQNFQPQPFQEPAPQPQFNQNFNQPPVANFQPQPHPQANLSQQPQPFGNPQSNQNPPAFFGDYQQNQPQPAPVANFQPQPVAQTTFAEPSPTFNVISPKPEENFIEPASFPLPQVAPSKPEEKLPPIKEPAKLKENPFVAPKLEEITENNEDIDSMDDFIASSGDSAEIEKEVEKIELKPQSKPVQKPDPFKVKDNFDLSLDVPKNNKNFQPKKKEDINMESLVKDNKYRPNPLLDNTEKEKSDKKEDLKFEYKPKNSSSKPQSNQPKDSEENKEIKKDDLKFEFTPQIKRNNNNSKPELNQNSKPKIDQKTKENTNNFSKEEKSNQDTNSNPSSKNNPKDAISFSDLKEGGTKEMLNEIYQDYVSTYDTNQRKFMNFLERITKLLSNYENIADHFEDLTKKHLQMNDTIVAQAKDIQLLKSNTRLQGDTPVQDQIEDLQYDLDKLEKEVRILRTETRRKFDDVNQQLAAVGADNYKENGVMQKIELLKSEINQIKNGQANNIVKFNRGNSGSESDQQANNVVRFNQNQNRRNQDRNRQSDRNSNDQQNQTVVKKSNLDLTGIL